MNNSKKEVVSFEITYDTEGFELNTKVEGSFSVASVDAMIEVLNEMKDSIMKDQNVEELASMLTDIENMSEEDKKILLEKLLKNDYEETM